MSPDRTSDERLLADLAEALAPPEREIDPDRVRALRMAAESARSEAGPVAPPVRRRSRGWRAWLASSSGPAVGTASAAVVVALVAGVLIGGSLADDDAGRGDVIASGVVEYDGSIELGAATGTLTVVNTGIGREIDLETSDLPILPKGEFYEVWFVGPDDSPRHPNRISAGTFHPDENGDSAITLTAAVDPSLYPHVVVTAEAGNGDPRSSGRAVLRAEID